MTIAYVTLKFPNYEVAKSAAQQLGFWDTENDRLNTAGQTIRSDGSAFSWAIDEIGQLDDGYYVNATGELPAEVEPFIVPYGSGGRIFAGTEELIP